jgi:DNA-binding FrmR family transcriptional regulator
MSHASHTAHINRVNRIEGQVKGIKAMIEEEKYCVDILTQIKAARSALKSLELLILEGHAGHCITNAVKSGSAAETEKMINEIIDLVKRSSKS